MQNPHLFAVLKSGFCLFQGAAQFLLRLWPERLARAFRPDCPVFRQDRPHLPARGNQAESGGMHEPQWIAPPLFRPSGFVALTFRGEPPARGSFASQELFSGPAVLTPQSGQPKSSHASTSSPPACSASPSSHRSVQYSLTAFIAASPILIQSTFLFLSRPRTQKATSYRLSTSFTLQRSIFTGSSLF